MNGKPVYAAITYKLTGLTTLISLEFRQCGDGGDYALDLVLAKGMAGSSDSVRMHCEAVSQFEVKGFGGGHTQLLYLVVEDVSDRQWDRVRFRVGDAEDDKMSFYCNAVVVSDAVRV
jgi:hypothetical protein